MTQTPYTPAIPTVRDALELHTMDVLKPLLKLLPEPAMGTRKADLIAAIARHLSGERLSALWRQLDELQQLAVAEALYTPGGEFDPDRFQAKYGSLPLFGIKNEEGRWAHRETPTLLRLFLYPAYRSGAVGDALPADLQARLREWVPRPPGPSLEGKADLPPCFLREEHDVRWQDGDPGRTIIMRGAVMRMPSREPRVETHTVDVPLEQRNTEAAAVTELTVVLRLVEQGRLTVSEKTALPSAVTVRSVAELLRDGDFYPPSTRTRMAAKASARCAPTLGRCWYRRADSPSATARSSP